MGGIGVGNGLIGYGADKRPRHSLSIMVLASQLGGAPLDKPAQLAERSLTALHQFISNNQAAMIDYHCFQQAGIISVQP